MTIFTLDTQSSSKPLYQQLADSIEHAIFRKRLQPGERLPTHRDLADTLGINVTTITRGYKEAERRGLVAGTVGRGTYVSSDAMSSTSMVPLEPHAPGMLEMGLVSPLYDFDPDLSSALKKLCRSRDISTLLHYSDPAGLPEHRAVAALWASRFGLQADPVDMVVCAGAQHALSCAFSGLFTAGDCIAVDCVTYPGIKTLAAMLGLRLIPVEMDQSGMNAESLDRICRRQKIKGVYLMPGMQNPTTTCMPENRREELAKSAKRHGLILIEDDAYSLSLNEVVTPVSNFMMENSIYIAGMSKALAAGLRTAFVRVPHQFHHPFCEAVLNTIWMAPPLNAEIAKRWIKDGTVDRVLFRKKEESAIRFHLAEKILQGFSFAGIETGFFIWLTLPEGWKGLLFEQRMRELGVDVFGAEKFTVGDAPSPAAARISLSCTKNREDLASGLKQIKRVLDEGPQKTFSVTM